MTHEEIKKLLNDYFDEQLSIEVNTETQVHLSECEECSQYLYSLQELMKEADKLPKNIKPPVNFWQDIFVSLSNIKAENIKQKEALDQKEVTQQASGSEEERKLRKAKEKAEKLLASERKKIALRSMITKPSFMYSVIGLLSVFILFLIYNFFMSRGDTWEVKKFQVASGSYSEAFSSISEDEVLQTNSIVRLQVRIPGIGNIFVDPDTRIQKLKSNHVRLLQGSILVSKDGAHELLNIEVPGAEISDFFLGGQSKIALNNQNTTSLEVIDGWILVKKENLESLVLPNHFCTIIADSGIGLPYRNGSSNEFIEAINDYCFSTPSSEEALISILTKADVSNSVTLWNLMKRVTRKQREMVIYTLFGLLGEPPLGVTDDGLKALDSGMLRKLIEEIEVKI